MGAGASSGVAAAAAAATPEELAAALGGLPADAKAKLLAALKEEAAPECPIRKAAMETVMAMMGDYHAGKMSTALPKEEMMANIKKWYGDSYTHDCCDGNAPWGPMKQFEGAEAMYDYLVIDDKMYTREDLKGENPTCDAGSNVVRCEFSFTLKSKTKPDVSMKIPKMACEYTAKDGKIVAQAWKFPVAGVYEEWKEKFEPLYKALEK